MKLYVLKSLAALLNFLLISFVVRLLPESLAGEYLLVLGYIVLGALIVGFGIDTGVERYARRLLIRWSRLRFMLLVLGASLLRTGALFGFVSAANLLSPGFIEVGLQAYVLAFVTFLFTTLTAVLNGVLRYTASAISNLVRAPLRFLIFAVPVETLTLETMLAVEVLSACCGTLYCAVAFFRGRIDISGTVPEPRVVAGFLGWNYLSRLFLNLISLNTAKILILRSNHPDAVLYAYAIQLTEAVERFLPSIVLAGRYRPELSRAYDEQAFGTLKQRLRRLGRYSLLSAAVMAVLHLAVIPLAFIILQNEDPGPYWPLIAICGIWLFVTNIKFSLNIVSNVIEANYIQFLASLMLTIAFFSVFAVFAISDPVTILLILTAAMCVYPLIWLAFAIRHLRALAQRTD